MNLLSIQLVHLPYKFRIQLWTVVTDTIKNGLFVQEYINSLIWGSFSTTEIVIFEPITHFFDPQ